VVILNTDSSHPHPMEVYTKKMLLKCRKLCLLAFFTTRTSRSLPILAFSFRPFVIKRSNKLQLAFFIFCFSYCSTLCTQHSTYCINTHMVCPETVLTTAQPKLSHSRKHTSTHTYAHVYICILAS